MGVYIYIYLVLSFIAGHPARPCDRPNSIQENKKTYKYDTICKGKQDGPDTLTGHINHAVMQ